MFRRGKKQGPEGKKQLLYTVEDVRGLLSNYSSSEQYIVGVVTDPSTQADNESPLILKKRRFVGDVVQSRLRGRPLAPDEILLVEVLKLSFFIFACLQLTTMGVFFSSIMRFDVRIPIHNISCMVNNGGGGGMESGGCGRRRATFT